ncbi:uncharacterized protein DSM5745_00333 [Aspergillus mulundensis]|uniref:Uncharacterized protein n=1 Tax=Aspergillus mulundensis TaxID=1810919 RepID=A0A3D8T3H9_9EURO|nr:hypothetical protein DSM5745_00333 [Aspergillus mulundensis]RDW93011.1 hypothetical protein DSM5745_00333 [Aspergillus mulundensis]
MKLSIITLPILGFLASSAAAVKIDTKSRDGEVSTTFVPFGECGNFPEPAVAAHTVATPKLDKSKYYLCIFFDKPDCRGTNVGNANEGKKSPELKKWAKSAHCLK